MEQNSETCRFILSCNYSSKIIEPIQSRCAVFRFRPLDKEQILERISVVANNEGIKIEDQAADAIAKVSLGDLRKAITSLQVAASLDSNVTRDLVYETTATAPPEQLHRFFLSCKEDGFQPARRRLKDILNLSDSYLRELIKKKNKQKPWETLIVSENLTWDEFSKINFYLHDVSFENKTIQ